LRPAPLTRLRQDGVPAYDSLELAVRCLQALAEFGEVRNKPPFSAQDQGERQAVFEHTLAACRKEGRSVVLEHEARQALAAAGVTMGAAQLATTEADAVAAFQALRKRPVAMKVVSPDIIHKSDAGGVKLNIADEDGVRRAFVEIIANGRKHVRDPDIRGILVTPMADKGGVEVIIGVVRDPTYGAVMMFGLGGILVEVLKDVVFRALPLTEADAPTMLEEIRAKRILDGVRGAPPVDKEALVRLMLGISALCSAFPEIDELDLNPVLAYPQGVGILDARILLDSSPQTVAH